MKRRVEKRDRERSKKVPAQNHPSDPFLSDSSNGGARDICFPEPEVAALERAKT